MRLIGLTGRSGSGKTEVGRCAAALEIPVFNCDEIYAEMSCTSDEFLQELTNTLGKKAVVNHQLNRPHIRKLVFSNKKKRILLNQLTAKYMTLEIEKRLKNLGPDVSAVLLDAPTLYDCGMESICDKVICVIAPETQSIERIMVRDGISEEQARLRLDSQLSNDFFREHADYLIENDSGLEALKDSAVDVIRKVLSNEKED